MIELLLVILVIALIGIIVWQMRPKKAEPDQSMMMLHQQVESLRGQVHETLDNNAKLFQQTIESLQNQVATGLRNQSDVLQKTNVHLNERLDNAAKVIGDVHRKLGEVSSTMQAVADIKDILKAPKSRGGFGELLLGDILYQMLPRQHVELQYKFQNIEAVDAVIRLGDRLIPIDSKFPLENYQRIVAAGDENTRQKAKTQFNRDLRKHVDAVSKYIRPNEGTYDFALMYIPSESIYYEVVARNETMSEEKSVMQESLEKRVIPVSPNTLYVYLMTIALGLRGMQVEKQAQYVLDQLGRLQKDFSVFSDEYSKMGKHLENARNTYDRAGTQMNRFGEKLSQVIPTSGHADLVEPVATDSIEAPVQ